MKIDYVIVKAGCTLRSRSTVLYSAIIQDGSKLGPLTLILKGESIPADSMWFGAPAMPWV